MIKTLLIPALLLPAFSLSLAEPAAPIPSAMVEYPARGNVQLDEGTVEIYLTTLSDIDDSPQPQSFPLWELNLKDSDEKLSLFYMPAAKRFILAGYVRPLTQSWVISHKEGQPGIVWKAGERHVIAFTWKGDRRQIYIDGVPGDETKVEGRLELNPARCTIRLGGPFNALWQIDEFRISSVRRSADELRNAIATAPLADIHTLLLDHFDSDAPAIQLGNPKTPVRTQTGPVTRAESHFGQGVLLRTAGSQ